MRHARTQTHRTMARLLVTAAVVVATIGGSACASHRNRGITMSVPAPPRRSAITPSNGEASAAARRAQEAIGRVRDKLRHPGTPGEQGNGAEQNEFLPSGPIVATTGDAGTTPHPADPTSSVVYTAPESQPEGSRLLSDARQPQPSSSSPSARRLTPMLLVLGVLLIAAVSTAIRLTRSNRQQTGA